jgi:hypothetical protein
MSEDICPVDHHIDIKEISATEIERGQIDHDSDIKLPNKSR